MRKFILISAMVLASATAQAATSRGLVLASNDEAAAIAPAVQEQATTPAQESAPVYVARPAAVEVKTDQPKAELLKPAPEKTAAETASPLVARVEVAKAEKPRRRHASTEARVIYELHRHGIYW